MKSEPLFITSGGVTSPKGFLAGATNAGIKHADDIRSDLGILFSEKPCTAAAVFTTNQVKASSVILDEQRIKTGKARAVVVSSGCANACTGQQGMADAVEMAELAAQHTGIEAEDVLVASTGVIGVCMPMERIRAAIPEIELTVEGGNDIARAIMTTDTVPKEIAIDAGDFIIGGMAKGSGMIHPNMATLLGFLTTDAAAEASFLKQALHDAVDMSFNMVSIDGDNSTNDMVILMANGMSNGEPIVPGSQQAELFQQALNRVCIYLARAIAWDGEGATRLIEVTVSNAKSLTDARLAARTIVSSSLVKAAVHGRDPNWGRVVVAAGRSGATVEMEKIGLEIDGVPVLKAGSPVPYDRDKVVTILGSKEVPISLSLNLGNAKAVAWGCDLSAEYVRINADYTT